MTDKREKVKEIGANTIYTILGALVFNGVLQLFIYPTLTARLGAEEMGSVHFILGIAGVLGPSIGQALNTGRLIFRREHSVENGDYTLAVLLFSIIALVPVLPYVAYTAGHRLIFPAAILTLLTIYRFYGDVEYRLSLKYRHYFYYYLLASAGYILGFLIFRSAERFYLIFLAGEAAALLFVALTGHIFKGFFKTSRAFSLVLRKSALLIGSYLITNITLNLDRLILKNLIGGEAVTIYYVVSLIGKTLILFVAPLNTILISYLTKDRITLTRGQFLKFAGAGGLVSLLFFILCEIGTPLYIHLFYPTLWESSAPLVTVVNLSQILAVFSAYLFILVLTFTREKWQLYLQAGHFILLILLILYLTPRQGLAGFSMAVLFANALRVGAVLVLGFLGARTAGRIDLRSQ